MLEDDKEQKEQRNIKTVLELKDVVIILSAVLTASAAYFEYGTRITVLESQIEEVTSEIQGVRVNAHELNSVLNKLTQYEVRLSINDKQLDDLEQLGRKLDKITDVQIERVERGKVELDRMRDQLNQLEQHITQLQKNKSN